MLAQIRPSMSRYDPSPCRTPLPAGASRQIQTSVRICSERRPVRSPSLRRCNAGGPVGDHVFFGVKCPVFLAFDYLDREHRRELAGFDLLGVSSPDRTLVYEPDLLLETGEVERGGPAARR